MHSIGETQSKPAMRQRLTPARMAASARQGLEMWREADPVLRWRVGKLVAHAGVGRPWWAMGEAAG